MIGTYSIGTKAISQRERGIHPPGLYYGHGGGALFHVESQCYNILNRVNNCGIYLQIPNLLLPPPEIAYVTRSYNASPYHVLTTYDTRNVSVCRQDFFVPARLTSDNQKIEI